MRRKSFRTLLAVATVAAPLLSRPAWGAELDTDRDGEISQPLVNEELSNELGSTKPGDTVETPPPAEYPYPGASEDGYQATQPQSPAHNPARDGKLRAENPVEGFDANPAAKSTEDFNGQPTAGKDRSDGQVRRPASVNEDGSYNYGKELKNVKAHPAVGIEAPIKTDAQGEYFYKDVDENPESTGTSEIQKPTQITSKGEYVYKTRRTVAKTDASVRFGLLTPPALKNSEATNITFQDIYGSSSLPLVIGDYEWRLSSKVGRLGVKFTTGVATASGNGMFTSTAEGRPSLQALEKFTFVLFPNELTAIYKFQYADNQLFVPFVEGGLGYFTFAELRDDNKSPKIGGAPVAVAAGGGNFLLDWMDKSAIHKLDADYGVSHVWLTAEVRQILGLSSNLNFTSRTYNVGFLMEF